jgi:hypothetical protein
MTELRRYKVRGQNMLGSEVSRVGDRVTLMCAPPCWPFVRERVFDRADIVRIDGANNDDEPKPAKPVKAKRSRKVAA